MLSELQSSMSQFTLCIRHGNDQSPHNFFAVNGKAMYMGVLPYIIKKQS